MYYGWWGIISIWTIWTCSEWVLCSLWSYVSIVSCCCSLLSCPAQELQKVGLKGQGVRCRCVWWVTIWTGCDERLSVFCWYEFNMCFQLMYDTICRLPQYAHPLGVQSLSIWQVFINNFWNEAQFFFFKELSLVRGFNKWAKKVEKVESLGAEGLGVRRHIHQWWSKGMVWSRVAYVPHWGIHYQLPTVWSSRSDALGQCTWYTTCQ